MRAIPIALAMVVSGAAWAEPQTTFSGTTPTAVTGLSEENGCFPAKLNGRVVKRAFDANGITVTSITIEERSGERSFINVDDENLKTASMSARSNAIRAMQILLKEGARVNLGIFACGAAGRVMMLDAVRAAR